VNVLQQTVQSILINSVITIVACFVVGVGNVTAAKKLCLGTLEHVKNVKVHTTYFLHVEASTKA
jgi:heme/copper-type cytochrome/quinol oxidase subunit 4